MRGFFLILYLVLSFVNIALFFILMEDFSILFATIVMIVVALFFGYILYNFLNEQKAQQDIMIEHIVKETLHEINLPISTIEANIDMLIKRLNEPKDIKKANRIKKALDRLKRLYQELSYNIKKEIIKIEEEIVNLEDILKDRVSYFEHLNRNRFILNTKPLFIKIDKIGLEQSIDNIIENAMKYSKKDSDIIIKVDGSRVIIEDFGIGIEQSELSLIYQRYYQGDNLNKGEGIGLSIVKSFCDRNRVDLKIKSQKGVGTKVIFDFKNRVYDKKNEQN